MQENNNSTYFKHTSPDYSQELEKLHQQLVSMAVEVLQQVTNAFTSLLENNIQLAKQVMKNDQRINDSEKRIDSHIITTIALRQPAARDLRMLVSGLKLIQDLERIGDEAKRFASISAFIIDDQMADSAKPLSELSELVTHRLQKSCHALSSLSLSDALIQLRKDSEIEIELRNQTNNLVKLLKDFPEHAWTYLRLSNCIRSCERISDHCSNICEYIVYEVQGLDVRHLGNQSEVPTKNS
ncbi:MAG: phosphate signaling complex protein PhoU [Methylacidiphilales bacterium]|nr:phosphate signaling complex protein PhoU [Candidatus Methylacidiphilales bacterium]